MLVPARIREHKALGIFPTQRLKVRRQVADMLVRRTRKNPQLRKRWGDPPPTAGGKPSLVVGARQLSPSNIWHEATFLRRVRHPDAQRFPSNMKLRVSFGGHLTTTSFKVEPCFCLSRTAMVKIQWELTFSVRTSSIFSKS